MNGEERMRRQERREGAGGKNEKLSSPDVQILLLFTSVLFKILRKY